LEKQERRQEMLMKRWLLWSVTILLLLALIAGCRAATPTPSAPTPAPAATTKPPVVETPKPVVATPKPVVETPKPSPALPDVAAQFKGKTMSYIVPFPPGGGYDYFARVTAPFIQKYAGVDKVIVENKPGAGGLVAYNYLYNEAKPDGLTICIVQGPTMFTRAIVATEGIKYDLGRFTVVGRINTEPNMAVAGAKTGFKSVADLKSAPKFTGAVTSKDDLSAVSAAIMAEALGLSKMKLVPGYAGSSEAILSVVRG
jgi:tripartite-type tricarboxylate transporter receptor subunit TctC